MTSRSCSCLWVARLRGHRCPLALQARTKEEIIEVVLGRERDQLKKVRVTTQIIPSLSATFGITVDLRNSKLHVTNESSPEYEERWKAVKSFKGRAQWRSKAISLGIPEAAADPGTNAEPFGLFLLAWCILGGFLPSAAGYANQVELDARAPSTWG